MKIEQLKDLVNKKPAFIRSRMVTDEELTERFRNKLSNG